MPMLGARIGRELERSSLRRSRVSDEICIDEAPEAWPRDERPAPNGPPEAIRKAPQLYIGEGDRSPLDSRPLTEPSGVLVPIHAGTAPRTRSSPRSKVALGRSPFR